MRIPLPWFVSAVALSLTIACGGDSGGPASPSPTPTPAPAPAPTPAPSPAPAPTPTTVGLTGVITAQGGARLAGATVTVLDPPNAGRTTTTNGAGEYRFDGLTSANANVSANAAGYAQNIAGVFINGTNTLNIVLRTAEPWTNSGRGNTVFDMPTYITRVRVRGQYAGFSSNFIVRVAGRLTVNELLGSGWPSQIYEGIHLTTGGIVEITNSSDVVWTFTEVR